MEKHADRLAQSHDHYFLSSHRVLTYNTFLLQFMPYPLRLYTDVAHQDPSNERERQERLWVLQIL